MARLTLAFLICCTVFGCAPGDPGQSSQDLDSRSFQVTPLKPEVAWSATPDPAAMTREYSVKGEWSADRSQVSDIYVPARPGSIAVEFSDSDRARTIDLETGEGGAAITFPDTRARLWSMDVSPDGSLLAKTDFSRHIAPVVSLWNFATGESTDLSSPDGKSAAVRFLDSTRLLVVTSVKKRELRLTVWNLETEQPVKTFTAPHDNAPILHESLATSPGGRYCVLAEMSGLRIFDLDEERECGQLSSEGHVVAGVGISQDGTEIGVLLGAAVPNLRCLDFATGKLKYEQRVTGAQATGLLAQYHLPRVVSLPDGWLLAGNVRANAESVKPVSAKVVDRGDKSEAWYLNDVAAISLVFDPSTKSYRLVLVPGR